MRKLVQRHMGGTKTILANARQNVERRWPSQFPNCLSHAGRVNNCPRLPRMVLVLALEVPHPRKLLNPGQMATVGHPTHMVISYKF